MCEELKEAVQSANLNTDVIAQKIDTLSIPCKFKGVFMHMADERGFRFDSNTLNAMQIIGETKSEVCLDLLTGNHKKAGLISAYRLATELDQDRLRAEAVQIVLEKKSTVNERSILLAILTVRGKS